MKKRILPNHLRNKARSYYYIVYAPASEASIEVANLTGRKNLHTTVYGVKEFVRLYVCLLKTLTPII